MAEIDRAGGHADADDAITRRYEALARAGDITADAHQRAVLRRLDRLSEEVTRRQLARKSSALGWLFARGKPVATIRGVYLAGAVGRGKTMLMDLFFNAAQTPRKRRVHFNAFMADIHDRIGRHRALAKAGKAVGDDPIPPVAKAVAAESWLLCFDEFSVTDIADAMILSRLFTALFAEGVVLVATSNVPPDGLYKDGLNRSLFTPFLGVLARHVDAVSLDGPVDYRLTRGRLDPHWLTPADRDADAAMDVAWAELGPESAGELKVKGRTVALPRLSGRAARFSFAELCEQPHGARDYLALAERIDMLFLDHVPVMDNASRNAAKRFILLIDTLYDRRIALRASAAAEPDGLCRLTSGTEKFEFARTASRLDEMRSEGWDKAVGDAAER